MLTNFLLSMICFFWLFLNNDRGFFSRKHGTVTVSRHIFMMERFVRAPNLMQNFVMLYFCQIYVKKWLVNIVDTAVLVIALSCA